MEQSYDFSNPLILEQMKLYMSNLMASAQMLTPLVQGSDEARYGEYHAILNQSLYRLLRLMQNIEYLATPEQPATLKRQPIDPLALCHSLYEQVAPITGQLGVSFRFIAEGDYPLTTADAELLRRMLLNLVSNALRTTGEGGEIGLRLRSDAGRLFFIVWDNGEGYTGEALSADPDDFANRPDGARLGLEVVRRIARLHNGTLVFEQSGERGTRATVSLPVVPPENKIILRTPPSQHGTSGGFSTTIIELSGVLPHRFFLPGNLE